MRGLPSAGALFNFYQKSWPQIQQPANLLELPFVSEIDGANPGWIAYGTSKLAIDNEKIKRNIGTKKILFAGRCQRQIDQLQASSFAHAWGCSDECLFWLAF